MRRQRTQHALRLVSAQRPRRRRAALPGRAAAAILLLMLLPPAGAQARGLYFEGPDCPPCARVWTEIAAPLLNDHPELTLRRLSVERPAAHLLLSRARKLLTSEGDGTLPMLVVGDRLYSGEAAVRAALADRARLAGDAWPAIPGLERVLAEQDAAPLQFHQRRCDEGACEVEDPIYVAVFAADPGALALEDLRARWTQVVVERFDPEEDAELGAWLAGERAFQAPAAFVGRTALLGAEATEAAIAAAVERHVVGGAAPRWDDFRARAEPEAPAGEGPRLDVFVRADCPKCAAAKAWIEASLLPAHPTLRLRYHDVARDPEARLRFRQLAEKTHARLVGVPAFAVGDELVIGFTGPETTGEHLQTLLAAQRDGAEPRAEPPGVVDVPFLGEVDATRLGLPAFTIVLGLLDGFNPCAMWVLLFILSLLVNLKSRKRMLAIAGTFVVVSGLVYFAFMAAWLNVFFLLGISRAVQATLGVVALVVGGINVKDFFAFGKGVSLGIPDAAKPGIYRRARRILHAESTWGAIAAVIVLAVLVNFVELLCTAGLPAIYTQVLSRHDLPGWAYYAYLALYNVAYMLDDGLMVGVAVITLSNRRLQASGGRQLKLLSGTVMVVLGVLLLVKPEWLAW